MKPIRSNFPLLGILVLSCGVAAGQDAPNDDVWPAARMAPWLKKMDQSSLVQAVCASATPTDLGLFSPDYSRMGRPGGLLAGPEATLQERGRQASPISHVHKDAPPILLFHGTKDTTVDVKHSDTFVEALKKAGAKDVTYLRIDGAGHGVYGQHKKQTEPAMEKFFVRTLKGNGPRP
jgi:dipeptidyl aminopeptidase/acylaminoacyl peptidase